MDRRAGRLARALCSACLLSALPVQAAAQEPRGVPPADSAAPAEVPLPDANVFMRGLAERQRGREEFETYSRYRRFHVETEEAVAPSVLVQ